MPCAMPITCRELTAVCRVLARRADDSAVVVSYGEKLNQLGLVWLSKPGVIAPLLTDQGLASLPAVSPDGKWLAFTSTRAGKSEVYVAPLSVGGEQASLGERRIQISSGGGSETQWRRDSREIIYLSPDARVMSVTLTVSGSNVEPGKPAELFRIASADVAGTRPFAANADLTEALRHEQLGWVRGRTFLELGKAADLAGDADAVLQRQCPQEELLLERVEAHAPLDGHAVFLSLRWSTQCGRSQGRARASRSSKYPRASTPTKFA